MHIRLKKDWTDKFRFIKVIEILIENPSVTASEPAERIGVTKRSAEKAFKSLQEKKLIERLGSKKDGNWIVLFAVV